MSSPIHNVIDGRFVDSADGRRSDLINPSTGEVAGSAPLSGPDDVDAAYSAAVRAFRGWRDSTPAERQAALLKLADAVGEHAEELTAAECAETGKPITGVRDDEIPAAVDQIRFFAGACRTLDGLGAGEFVAGHTSYVRREPVGVIGQVTPWNFPLLEAVGKIAPAIAAGNTVVLKPSDTTPSSTVLLAELASRCLPPGVINVVCGDRETGRAVVSHPAAAMVAITGSTKAGQEVAAAAAPGVKRTHLELGGKAPVIVFEDADLERAVPLICEAAYGNAGQDCTAATRVLAAAEIADRLAEMLAKHAAAITVGPPDSGAFYGPLNNAAQLERVAGFLERLPDHSTVLTGGRRHGDQGYFWQPTVVTGVRQEDEISRAEVFGPVITVQQFHGEDEAISAANDVAYGLAASIWTDNHARALRTVRELDFGTVWINAHSVNLSELPHGGFKQSGHGKNMSVFGLEEYTRIKHVTQSFAR
ncbi:aminobutyraldehyde dehydrogenase [Streptomyces chartreusis]|uniref:aminobutyraldehyde dehydrogenase n=1 Tax=Streptomyces chartreusis TaxID=1969 RepID=UPI0036C47F49